ncbi:MAG: tetratricopeptide repeat protein [Alphaproteobacteria bacterium]|nr:tetratricopeptide repeat protein [Alphaproteobacteria bacterium]
MSSRAKFLLWLLLSVSGFVIAFKLFMSTDYAQKERGWFRNYPYREIAARKQSSAKAGLLVKAKIISSPVKINPPIKIYHNSVIKKMSRATPADRVKARPSPLVRVKRRLGHQPPQRKATFHQPPPKKANLYQSDRRRKGQRRQEFSDDDGRSAARRGYQAYGHGDYQAAIRYLEQAVKSAPDKRALQEQLAYAYKATGQFLRAVRYFKQAIDSYDKTTVPLRLKTEVAQLQRRVTINGYVIYRNESSPDRQLGADLTRSQMGVEISDRPGNAIFDHKLQLYARLLAAMTPGRLDIDPNSYQAGVGLRLKPFLKYNLVLSAERLIGVGRFGRNDWMVRAGYSQGYGRGYRNSRSGWWHYNLYLDAALINPASPDIYLTAQASGGYTIPVAPGFVLQPRLTMLINWQKDHFRTATLVEAGPGINMRYYFNETKYTAYRSYIDLTIEYRLKIAGSSIGGSGPVIGIQFHF